MNVNGYAVALMVLIAIGAGFCWLHRWLPRAVSIGAALFAICAVAGIPAWRDALAGVFGSGPGMLILVLIAIFGMGSFVVDHIRHHHPVRSTALGLVGATALILAYAMRSELGHRASKLGPKTAAAMSQASAQISSGQAAHAETASTRLMIIFVVILGVVVLISLMRKQHNKRPYRNAKPFGVLPAGGSSRALPAGSSGPGGPGGGGGGKRKPGLFRRLIGA